MSFLFPDGENSASRRFLLSAAFWFFGGTLMGLVGAISLYAPDFFRGISWLEFGRIRPAHVNTVLLGFVGPMLVGGTLYIIPAMLRTRLASERLANAAWWLWNLAIVGEYVTLPLGYTQGREYAEFIFPVKCVLVLSLALLTYVGIQTLMKREENLLYVSVWYGVGALLWTTLLYPIGNVMWDPWTGSVGGIMDAVLLWWYGHNIFGLVVTPMAVGICYYVIPRVSGKPLYSHTLSLIGFWSLLAFYTHIGTHHLIQAPVPTWLKTISIIDSIAMIVPVATVLVNLWLTMRGSLSRFADNLPGKMIFVGTIWYLITCIQGPMQSLPSVQRFSHFNNWVIGHAHIAVLGFGGFIALGTLWYFLPLVTGRKVWSWRLVSLQYWLVLIGLVGFFLVLTIAGLIQGQAWIDGETVYRALPSIAPYMAARAMFGVMIVSAALIGLYNSLMTAWFGERIEAIAVGDSAVAEGVSAA